MLPKHLEELRLLQSTYRLGPADRSRHAELIAELLSEAIREENALKAASHRKRRSVRMRRAVPVEITWGPQARRSITLDLGPGGLSTLLEAAPARDVTLSVRLQLSSRVSVTASARVVSSQLRNRGTCRVSLALVEMADEDRTRLEAFLAADALVHVALLSARTG